MWKIIQWQSANQNTTNFPEEEQQFLFLNKVSWSSMFANTETNPILQTSSRTYTC